MQISFKDIRANTVFYFYVYNFCAFKLFLLKIGHILGLKLMYIICKNYCSIYNSFCYTGKNTYRKNDIFSKKFISYLNLIKISENIDTTILYILSKNICPRFISLSLN